MRTLSVSLAALAVAGMTALPAGAQTVLEPEETISAYGAPDRTVAEQLVMEERYYSADRSTYAIWDEDASAWNLFDAESDRFLEAYAEGDYQPNEEGLAEVEFRRMDNRTAYAAPDRTVAEELSTEERYYTEDRTTYGVFDPVQSVWRIFDATTDAFVEALPEAEYEPYEQGYAEVEFRRDAEEVAYDEPDRDVYESMQGRIDLSDLEPGIAEERYYDVDRATYGVWDPDARMWNVFDAETEQLVRSVPEAEYTRYEPGYTVIIPGDTQVGMGAGGESIAADPNGISDNRQ